MLRKGGGQLNTVQNNPSPFSVVDGGNKKINDSLASKNSGGDLILASQLFGNSPKTAKSNYYTGLNLEKAKMILEIK